MTVVVTGASGHVGANLVRKLLALGESVRATVYRDQTALQGIDVECVSADLLDVDSLAAAFANADLVYHLAGLISILEFDSDRLQQINVEGTRNVIKACRQCGVKRLVYTSSIEALMWPDGPDPIDESEPPRPENLGSAYARTKWAATQEVVQAAGPGLETVVVHPTAVVGPFDFKPSLFGQTFIAHAHRRLPGMVPGGFDLVDVGDLVAGMVAAAQKGKSAERYILSGSFVSLAELAQSLEKSTGVRRPRLTFPFWLILLVARVTPWFYRFSKATPRFTVQSIKMLRDGRQVSSAKAGAELGYHPGPGLGGVQSAVTWFQETGKIHPVHLSKKSPGIVMAAVAFLLICLMGGIHQLFAGMGTDKIWGVAALGVGGFYAWLNRSVRYEITADALQVNSGPFRWLIPTAKIWQVRPSRNPIFAPAWSWQRLRVEYILAGKRNFVLISPHDQQAFLRDLAGVDPGLQLDKDGTLNRKD